ncbi:MAG: class I SAM-dependent methyltransferase [Candidatus Eiseniibacteriota bacterium]
MEKTLDALAQFKDNQRKSWANFAPLAMMTTPAAARLVRHAGIRSGQRVLDVACGTGVVAITAARAGARASGLDLTPELIAHARESSAIANVDIDWHEGDAEELPFEMNAFDVVVSQFGHMFAPRPEVAVAEMLRVLKPGGTIAFATWPPELMTGRMFALVAKYAPPPPIEVPPPLLWGDPGTVRERLGNRVKDLVFDRATMLTPSLSPQHSRAMVEKTAGPVIKVVEALSAKDPAKLEAFRREMEALGAEYLSDNTMRQDFLMTRATKV